MYLQTLCKLVHVYVHFKKKISVYIYIYILQGGRSPKVSLEFTYVVVCLGFIEDCFRVYLGFLYWIFFRVYLGFI